MSQLILAGGLWTVIGMVVAAFLYRNKNRAEASKMQGEAARIADEVFTQKMKTLKSELFDAWGISEERRRIMAKMDTAINIMRIRMERHSSWDQQVKDHINSLEDRLRISGVLVDGSSLGPPPPLTFEDIDFDFRIIPPSKEIVAELAKEKGID